MIVAKRSSPSKKATVYPQILSVGLFVLYLAVSCCTAQCTYINHFTLLFTLCATRLNIHKLYFLPLMWVWSFS